LPQSVSSTPSSGGAVPILGSGVPAGFETVKPEIDDLELLVDLEGNIIGGPAEAKELGKLLSKDEKARLKKIIAEKKGRNSEPGAAYHEGRAKLFEKLEDGATTLSKLGIGAGVATALGVGIIALGGGAVVAFGTTITAVAMVGGTVAKALVVTAANLAAPVTSSWFF
jgi:hypothetical protein